MPETGIGYFPDVGVTRVLARLDGKIGQYLGMTGARISGEEAYLIGLATHYVSSSSIDSIAHRLSTTPAESALNPALVFFALQEFSSDPLTAKTLSPTLPSLVNAASPSTTCSVSSLASPSLPPSRSSRLPLLLTHRLPPSSLPSASPPSLPPSLPGLLRRSRTSRQSRLDR